MENTVRDAAYVHKPLHFFVIANAITWTFWLTSAYFSRQAGESAVEMNSLFMLLGLTGPSVAALWMVLTSNNRPLQRDFWNRLFNVRLITWSSLPAIFLLGPATVVASVLLSRLLGEPAGQLRIPGNFNFSAGLLPVPVVLFGAAFFEETGWRGYAMDGLSRKISLFKATLVFAGCWIFWHLSLFFIDHSYFNNVLKTNPWFAVNLLVSMIPFCFINNWLWRKNDRSILTPILLHAVWNFQGLLAMGQIAKCIQTGLLYVVAAVVVYANRETFFGADA